MRTAPRRQRLSNNKAKTHHSANQNTGWVMADMSLDNTNIKQAFWRSQKRAPDGPLKIKKEGDLPPKQHRSGPMKFA
jgi:hypothetical protein